MRRPYDTGSYPAVSTVLGEAAWADALSPEELADVFRSSLRADYADASDAEMADAVENVLDSMSAAEGFDFGAALSQIGRSASKVVSDPTFAQIVRTAAPIAGGALGTLIGGPVGTALGSQLGTLAAQALPAPAAPAAPPPVAAAPARASSVAGGSAAAAQGLVLTQQPEILRSLLATALGQQGRQQVSGVPVGRLLSLFSQVIGKAAEDADELMYLEQQPDAAESVLEEAPPGSVRSLYADLLGADNLEFAEAAGWEGLD